MCSFYRMSDGQWRVNAVCSPCRGTSRDYRLLIGKLLQLGYPREIGMRNQVPRFLVGIQDVLHLQRPVKATCVALDEQSTLQMDYVVEVFAGESGTTAEAIAQRIAQEGYVEAIEDALHAEATVESDHRFTREHLRLPPARCTKLSGVIMEVSWEMLPGTEAHAMSLDAACVTWEGQALQEVVDYRGAHGVRVVHAGVVDYSGHWLGKGIGDATDGAVAFVNEELDEARMKGHQTFTCAT